MLKSAEAAGSLRWDGSVHSYPSGVISGDERTVTCRGGHVSVRTRQGFRAGRHSWRVKVAGTCNDSSGIRLGIVPRGFSVWMKSYYAIGNAAGSMKWQHKDFIPAYGFYPGTPYGSWQSGQKPPTYAAGAGALDDHTQSCTKEIAN